MSDPGSDQDGKPVILMAVSTLRFSLGSVVATPGALALLAQHGVEPAELLSRHLSGDWGQVSADDAQANNHALKHGDRLLSAYVLPLRDSGAARDDTPAGDRVWVITEADRSSTCLLLPSEY
jgi:hypothetical protein